MFLEVKVEVEVEPVRIGTAGLIHVDANFLPSPAARAVSLQGTLTYHVLG